MHIVLLAATLLGADVAAEPPTERPPLEVVRVHLKNGKLLDGVLMTRTKEGLSCRVLPCPVLVLCLPDGERRRLGATVVERIEELSELPAPAVAEASSGAPSTASPVNPTLAALERCQASAATAKQAEEAERAERERQAREAEGARESPPEPGVTLGANEGARGARLLDEPAQTGRVKQAKCYDGPCAPPRPVVEKTPLHPVSRIALEVTVGAAFGAVGFFAGAAVAAVLQVVFIIGSLRGLHDKFRPWDSTWLWVGGAVGGVVGIQALALTGSALGGGGSRAAAVVAGLVCAAVVVGAWAMGGAPEVVIPLALGAGLVGGILAFEVSGLLVAPTLAPGTAGVALRGAF